MTARCTRALQAWEQRLARDPGRKSGGRRGERSGTHGRSRRRASALSCSPVRGLHLRKDGSVLVAGMWVQSWGSRGSPAGGGWPARVPVPITTARLIIRPFTAADFEAIHAVWSDPAVMGPVPSRAYDREKSWARLREKLGRRARHGFSKRAVVKKAGGPVTGECGVPYPCGRPGPRAGRQARPRVLGAGLRLRSRTRLPGLGAGGTAGTGRGHRRSRHHPLRPRPGRARHGARRHLVPLRSRVGLLPRDPLPRHTADNTGRAACRAR